MQHGPTFTFSVIVTKATLLSVQIFRMGINSIFAILITFRYQHAAVNILKSVSPRTALNLHPQMGQS